MYKRLTSLALLLFAITACRTEKKVTTEPYKSAETNKIDVLANRYLELGRFSGTILVAKHGSIIFNHSYGMADYESQKPFSDSTSFKIGRITELFTTQIIKEMDKKGMIDTKSRVQKYLPEIKLIYSIEDLVNHQSGLPNIKALEKDIPEPEYSTIGYANMASPDTSKSIQYSNLGYNLLGMVIEKVNNASYQQVIEQYFPNYDNTYFEKKAKEQARGYQFYNAYGNGPVLVQSLSYDLEKAFSNSGIKSTAKDILKLIRLHPEKALDIHGFIKGDGFSYSLSNEKSGLTIIVLSNRRHPVANEMSHSIKAIYEGAPYETPLLRKTVSIDTALLEEYAGHYEINSNFMVEIFTEKGSLFIKMESNNVSLLPQSENQFYMQENDAAIRFIRDSTNTISGAVLYNGFLKGKEIKKVEK